MRNNNQINVPEAREAGSVGGQTVKKISPVQAANYERHNRIAMRHIQTVRYIASIDIWKENPSPENQGRTFYSGNQVRLAKYAFA